LFPLSLQAAELEGVSLQERIRVDGQELQLNGYGLRTQALLFKLYVGGLYLSEKSTSAAAALAAKGAKRIQLTMVRDADSEQFVESIMHGLRANHSEAQLAAVKAQTDHLMAMIRRIGTSQKGVIIVLDYAPSSDGTTLFVDGKSAGRPMASEEFFRTLMRIWLGENPVDRNLKKALLGQS
jgi:chalcone isomerase-like protein